jgi:DNA repair protein RecO (recombination protein O)
VPVALYRDEAVVIRTQKLGEADRIVTLFSRQRGRIRAVAKGVRRTKSKFGARLEPASYVDAISGDYQRWTIASAILETAERFTNNEGEPALQQFLLLTGALKSLAHQSHDPSLILDAYLLRSLSIAGYAPSMTICSRCEAPGPHKYFSLVGGGSVCLDCRPSASATPALETLQLMSDLVSGDWQSAEKSEIKNRREASGLIAAYLQWHLERNLRSLPMVERVIL